MSNEGFTRWLSLHAYGIVTRTLFGPATHPRVMRRRFERFGATSRRRLLARHPGLVFAEANWLASLQNRVCGVY